MLTYQSLITDRGILMTFGSGANGCLGHGNYNDVSQAKIVEKLLGFEITQVYEEIKLWKIMKLLTYIYANTDHNDSISWHCR